MALAIISDARIVIGLDFGTTFSGFAYTHKSDPSKIYDLNRWPQSREAYIKTLTSLYYVRTQDGKYELKDWGWPALISYSKDLQQAARKFRQQGQKESTAVASSTSALENKVGCYLVRFKLQLADCPVGSSFPAGLTVDRVITDYLHSISTFILERLQHKYGKQLTMEQVQWCLTVPAIWSDSSKQKMKVFAQKAGMVAGCYTPKGVNASHHELLIVLEPEAASFYCHQKTKHLHLRKGDQFLVADVGGGTVDIVVHSKATEGPDLKVREVRASSGDMCGGSFVDLNFNSFLCEKIGCFKDFSRENMLIWLEFQDKFQQYKSTFDGEGELTFEFQIPARLAREWEKYDLEMKSEPREEGYEELDLSTADMMSIFDPQVERILQLIEDSMTKDVRVLMVVGGFSASPYMMNKINERFEGKVQEIINPPEPGSAICHGAVLMGMAGTSGIISRVSRKTYGIDTKRKFIRNLDPVDKMEIINGEEMCNDVFSVFVYKGEEVTVEQVVSHMFCPTYDDQTLMNIGLYTSSSTPPPTYITDAGVQAEGSFTLDISEDMKLGRAREIEITMSFGKSVILVQARRKNFGDTSALQEVPFKIRDGVL